MKYVKPVITDEEVEIEDIVLVSSFDEGFIDDSQGISII